MIRMQYSRKVSSYLEIPTYEEFKKDFPWTLMQFEFNDVMVVLERIIKTKVNKTIVVPVARDVLTIEILP